MALDEKLEQDLQVKRCLNPNPFKEQYLKIYIEEQAQLCVEKISLNEDMLKSEFETEVLTFRKNIDSFEDVNLDIISSKSE